jgi:hypothetical protein
VFPKISASQYVLEAGDVVRWVYTRDLGPIVGGDPGDYPGGGANEEKTDETKIDETETPLGAFEDWASPFKDVSAGNWFFEAVAYAETNGLMNGMGDDTFAPAALLTRAMMITILARSAGVDTTVGDTWFSEAVAWGVDSGITDGTNMGDNITREQFVTMLFRYAGTLGVDTSERADLAGFDDADKVSDWAQDTMAWAVAVGLVQGRTDTTLAPDGNATRAEAATLLMRFIENVVKEQ